MELTSERRLFFHYALADEQGFRLVQASARSGQEAGG